MENVGSTSAADDNTPAQPISSSTPLVPSFPDHSVSTTKSRKRGRPSPGMTTPSLSQVAGGGLSSPKQPQEDGANPGMTAPPPSQVAGGGLSSPTQPQADGANPGMTTPPPSLVAGGGLSSSVQPQADATAVSTGNKQQSVDLGSEVAGLGFMQSHVINIKTGEDILVKIMSFCESTSKSVCVLSATGSTSSVSLRRPYRSVTYKGVYDILSLTGFFFVLESGGRRSREGGLTAILGNEEDGDVWGGNVDGLFTAATDVQVIVSSFSTGKQVQQVKSDNFGTPATLSPMSVGSLIGSSVGPVSPDSPLIVTSKSSPTGVATRLPY